MTKVKLLGELGKKFGRVHRFKIATPAEAVRALCANFPEFRKHLVASADDGIGYKVLVGKDEIEPLKDLHSPIGVQTVSIVPVIAGSGPLGRVLAGMVLIAASVIVPPAGVLGISVLSGSAIAAVGFALALGGISQLLSPSPKETGPVENEPSYLFNGPVNTSVQGRPVSVGYGRMIVGSAVISAGIEVDSYVSGEWVEPVEV